MDPANYAFLAKFKDNTMETKHVDEIRAEICYDWKDHSRLMIGNNGEWYLGIQPDRQSFHVRCVSDKLYTLDQERVRCLQKYGQVDNHIKTKEARDDFEECVSEIRAEARYEEHRQNFGNAKRLRALWMKCLPLINDVWSDSWIENYETMTNVLAKMEP
jgi:hypothetical protein